MSCIFEKPIKKLLDKFVKQVSKEKPRNALSVDELIHLARLKLFLFNPNSDLRCKIYGDKKNAFWIEILYFSIF